MIISLEDFSAVCGDVQKTPWNLAVYHWWRARHRPALLVGLRKYMDVYLDCDYAETLRPACLLKSAGFLLTRWISNLFQKFLLGFWLIVDVYAGIRYWYSRAYLKPFELTGTTWNGPQRSQNGSKKLLCQLPQFFRSSIRWPWRPWVCEKRYESEFLLHDFFAKQKHPGSISWTVMFGFMEASRLLNADCANSESLCENLADKLQLTTWQVGKVFSFSDIVFFSRWSRTFVGGEINSNYEWMATNLLRPFAFCKIQKCLSSHFGKDQNTRLTFSDFDPRSSIRTSVRLCLCYELFTSKFTQVRFAKDLSWNCHLSLVLVNSGNCVGEHVGQIFFMFILTLGRFPFWLVFFKWIETTN